MYADESSEPQPDARTSDELNAVIEQAEALSEAGSHEAAVEALKRAAERFPDSPLPRHNLSVVYLARLREDYAHLEVWENLADDEAHFEGAVAEAEAALAIDEAFVPARNNLATLFALRGWWDDAIKHWEMSLTFYPDQPAVREDLADARTRIR